MSIPEGSVCVQIDFFGLNEPGWQASMRQGLLQFKKTESNDYQRTFVLIFGPDAWYYEFTWAGARWRLVATGVQMITASGELIRAFEWNESAGTRDMPLRRLTMTEDLNNPTQAPF